MSNQILIASTMVGIMESMLYAERAGLEVSEVIELIGKRERLVAGRLIGQLVRVSWRMIGTRVFT